MDLRKKVGETSLDIGTRERWILEKSGWNIIKHWDERKMDLRKKCVKKSLNIGTRERWILEKESGWNIIRHWD